jgi:hypothetical protein
MNTQQITTTAGYNFALQSFEDAQRFSKMIAESGVCPEALRGRPNDVMAILQHGHEIGLKPMQALRVLGVINGNIFAYGDGLTALCQRHPEYTGMEVRMSGKAEDRSLKATCTMKRKNQPDVTREYSYMSAHAAGLLGRGPWKLHLERMLQRRAMSYAAKDQFADAIMGILSEDEAVNIPTEVKVTTSNKGMRGLNEALGIVEEPEVVEAEFTTTLQTLKELIVAQSVKQKTIDSWLKKAKVETLEALTEDQLEKCITHLKSKENRDEVRTENGSSDQGREPS